MHSILKTSVAHSTQKCLDEEGAEVARSADWTMMYMSETVMVVLSLCKARPNIFLASSMSCVYADTRLARAASRHAIFYGLQ